MRVCPCLRAYLLPLSPLTLLPCVLWSQAGKLTSVKTQLPYWFYDLPYCEPKPENAKHKAEYSREYFTGYRTVNTPYKVRLDF